MLSSSDSLFPISDWNCFSSIDLILFCVACLTKKDNTVIHNFSCHQMFHETKPNDVLNLQTASWTDLRLKLGCFKEFKTDNIVYNQVFEW